MYAYYVEVPRILISGSNFQFNSPVKFLDFCGASIAERHLGITLSVVCLSVCPSVCHTFGLLIIFFTFRGRAFIFGMCVPYDNTFPKVP